MVEDADLVKFLYHIFSGDTLHKYLSGRGGRGRHHGWANGLAFHSVKATILASQIVDHYISIGFDVNKDIVIAGVLLHDIGKIECYEYNDDGTKITYTKANQLFHHIPIGYGIVLMAANEFRKDRNLNEDTLDHLLHIILSHHGKKAWSSPVIPQTLEAYIVHSIEMMDGYVESYSRGKIPDRIY